MIIVKVAGSSQVPSPLRGFRPSSVTTEDIRGCHARIWGVGRSLPFRFICLLRAEASLLLWACLLVPSGFRCTTHLRGWFDLRLIGWF